MTIKDRVNVTSSFHHSCSNRVSLRLPSSRWPTRSGSQLAKLIKPASAAILLPALSSQNHILARNSPTPQVKGLHPPRPSYTLSF